MSDICGVFLYIFFFKQKTAYEMRISDWSSDVCSSDLERMRLGQARLFVEEGASADLGRFQRTLKENDAAQPIARGVDQQGGVMLRLCGPKAIEIMLQMAELGIEIIAFAAERHHHALCFTTCQKLAIGPRAIFLHRHVSRFCISRALDNCLVIARISPGLAVRFVGALDRNIVHRMRSESGLALFCGLSETRHMSTSHLPPSRCLALSHHSISFHFPCRRPIGARHCCWT